MAQSGVERVEVEVTRGVAGQALVAGGDVVAAEELGESREPVLGCGVLEEPVQEDQPAEIQLGWTEAAISQSKTAAGSKSR